MKITLDPSQQERIYTPYLEIEYREKQVNLIHSDTKASVALIWDYYQDMDQFWNQIMIAFIIFQIFIALIVGIKMYFWIK